MNELDLIARSVGYTVVALLVIAASVWWGYELRTRLALKLEHFRISNRAWTEYDEQLKKSGKGDGVRAHLHDISERTSER